MADVDRGIHRAVTSDRVVRAMVPVPYSRDEVMLFLLVAALGQFLLVSVSGARIRIF